MKNWSKLLLNALSNELNIINNQIIMFASASLPFKSVYNCLSEPINFNPAEGSVNNRFFAGCKNIDKIEQITKDLTIDFFKLNQEDYGACVQPYSGSQANQIVYNAILETGKSCVLAMSPLAGGHVSHWKYLNKFYQLETYGTDENGILDYNKIEEICASKKIDLLIVGASSYPRLIDSKKIFNICKTYNIKLLADISHTVIYESIKEDSIIKNADFITFTTHKTTRGIRGGIILYKKDYEELINQSCFPLTQGAIKLNEILAKAMMFIELKKYNIPNFIDKIKKYKNYFVEYMQNKNVPIFTNGSDIHYVTIYFDNNMTGKNAENILANIGILSNRNKVKIKNNIFEGLRIGFLYLACIKFQLSDFKVLVDIIYDELFTNIHHTSIEVSSLIQKYNVLNRFYTGYY